MLRMIPMIVPLLLACSSSRTSPELPVTPDPLSPSPFFADAEVAMEPPSPVAPTAPLAPPVDDSLSESSCFEGTREIRIGDGGRLAAEPVAVAGFRDGWLVVYESILGRGLLITYTDGTVVADVPLETDSPAGRVQPFVLGEHLLLFSSHWVQRIDFNLYGVVREHQPLPFGHLHPHLVEHDAFEEAFRFVFLDGASTGVDGLSFGSLTLDADSETGLALESGDLSDVRTYLGISSTTAFYGGNAQVFVEGPDHLRALIRIETTGRLDDWRAVDIQLGLGRLGDTDAPITYRVWEDTLWHFGPPEIAYRNDQSTRFVGVGVDDTRGYDIGEAITVAPRMQLGRPRGYTDDPDYAVMVDFANVVRFFDARTYAPVSTTPLRLPGPAVLGRSWPTANIFAAAVGLSRPDDSAIGLRCFAVSR